MDNSPKTHPQVVLNMYEFFLLLNIFWRMQVYKQLMVVIYFHSMEKKKYFRSQGLPSTLWLPAFFQISSCVFKRRKKLVHVWNNMRLSKWWQHLNFWVDNPFKFWTQGDSGWVCYRVKKNTLNSNGKWLYFSAHKYIFFVCSKPILTVVVFFLFFLFFQKQYLIVFLLKKLYLDLRQFFYMADKLKIN